jgi:Mg-chelatase subunit ChlD
MTEKIPKEFLCPITLTIMKDPVIMSDGQTYERKAIEKALTISPLSPITKKPISMKDARTNYALRSMIERFLNKGENPLKKIKQPQKVDKYNKTKIKSFKTEVIDDPNNRQKVFVNITLEPEKQKSRKPLVLIAMIDVSGSMEESTTKDLKGKEDVGISRLGLVKHALKTVASTMNQEDKMCLITFETRAKMCLKATRVNDMGKNLIFDEIQKMRPSGCTNIWDALRLGMIEAQKYNGSNTCLMLFTDGEPNENPPMGIIPTLKEAISDIKKVNFTISTFAFGYSVDSKLMEEIAQIGNGIYGYCPDCTMVGTIFTSYMANILTTVESTVRIDVKNKFLEKKFEIGGLYSDIPRHLGFFINKSDFKNTEITLFLGQEEIDKINNIDYTEKNADILDQYYRNKLIDLIANNLGTTDYIKTAREITYLYSEIKRVKEKTEFMKNLLIDLINENPNHGQVKKAFTKEYYQKWGLDYLLSFLRFHVVEQRGNFKDQSLKIYGGNDFEEMLKIGNKIFVNLPPPENDCGGSKNISTDDFEDYFYNSDSDNGCFNGEAIVELKNGKKKVKDIKKGDILSNGAKVVCLIENKICKYVNVVNINNAYFSLYHPIEINGEWVFPCEYFKITKKYIDCWYNLVLDNKHEVVLNGVKAITLGHNRKEGVLKHPYFGTNKVIDALKKYDSFNSGFISTSNLKAHRTNNLIDQYY